MQGYKFENKIFKLVIEGSTARIACSMQGYKFESETFKQLIDGNTASSACSMHGDKNVRNPKYLTGAKREIYEFMEDFLPSTQYYQVLQWSIERPVRFILCDVGILVVMTGTGVAAFRRKDLK